MIKKEKKERAGLSSAMEFVFNAIEIPTWIKPVLGTVLSLSVVLLVTFQFITANPFGNRAAEAIIKSIEKSATNTEIAAKSIQDVAQEIMALRTEQNELEKRVDILEAHKTFIDRKYHK